MTLPTPEAIISLADANELADRFGKTITAEELALAELCISLRTGLQISDPDYVAGMDTVDQYWMAQAVVFQAIWSKGQPDLLTRIDQSQAATDGDAITLRHDAILLAPLAKWAILKTTMMGWDTVESTPTESILGTGLVRHDPENVGWKRWH